MVKLLLNHCADVNFPDKYGHLPIEGVGYIESYMDSAWAIEKCYKCVKLLLDAGSWPVLGEDLLDRIRSEDKSMFTSLILRARNRIRQQQRIAILVMSIRANYWHEYRYSILPLVGEIMKFL